MSAAFLDLAQNCAPQIAPATIAAVVSVESRFEPFAIRVNSGHPLADQPRTIAEAIETATILIAEDNDIDLGLGGINSGDLGRLGLSVTDAFDICLNLKATATLLSGYYTAALQDGATTRQAETAMLRRYFGHGDASIGEMVGYGSRVRAERERLSGRLNAIEITATGAQGMPMRERAGALPSAAPDAGRQPRPASAPRWDVFNSGRQSSVLVFPIENKE